MRAVRRWALALALLPAAALGGPRKIAILFTGDDRGEIGPCG